MANATQPRQRDLVRTRRQLLTAARHEIAERGAGVSLESIARVSGVSKGGLLHHFPSKEALLIGLAEDLYQAFERAVTEFAEAEPNVPGRLARAYVRATFREIASPDLLAEHGTLLSLIATVPAVSRFIGGKLENWSRRFVDDGIAPDVARLVMLATDGAAMGMVTSPQPDRSALRSLERQLLALLSAHERLDLLLNAPKEKR